MTRPEREQVSEVSVVVVLCSHLGKGLPYKEDRATSRNFNNIPKRYKDRVVWPGLEIFLPPLTSTNSRAAHFLLPYFFSVAIP